MVTKKVQGQMDKFANIGVFSSERGKNCNGAVIMGRLSTSLAPPRQHHPPATLPHTVTINSIQKYGVISAGVASWL